MWHHSNPTAYIRKLKKVKNGYAEKKYSFSNPFNSATLSSTAAHLHRHSDLNLHCALHFLAPCADSACFQLPLLVFIDLLPRHHHRHHYYQPKKHIPVVILTIC